MKKTLLALGTALVVAVSALSASAKAPWGELSCSQSQPTGMSHHFQLLDLDNNGGFVRICHNTLVMIFLPNMPGQRYNMWSTADSGVPIVDDLDFMYPLDRSDVRVTFRPIGIGSTVLTIHNTDGTHYQVTIEVRKN